MLDGEGEAKISSKAVGQTFKSDLYQREINGQRFNIFDTAGLGEAEAGTVPTKQAIQNLYDLIRILEDGINLLVFVTKPRIQASTMRDYNMFYETFCDRRVPIVIIVTNLEAYDMDNWWAANSEHFRQYRMEFDGQACITATKGRMINSKYAYQEEYDRSKRNVQALIAEKYSRVPWKAHRDGWFKLTLLRLFASIKVGPEGHRALIKALEENAGMTAEEARKYVRKNGKTRSVRRTSGTPRTFFWRTLMDRMRRRRTSRSTNGKERTDGEGMIDSSNGSIGRY
jgi:hypothetical protein